MNHPTNGTDLPLPVMRSGIELVPTRADGDPPETGKDFKQGVTTDSLCETTAESYGVQDFNSKMTMVTFRQGKDIRGPLSVAVSGSVSTGGGEKPKQGRFVAMGTSAAISAIEYTRPHFAMARKPSRKDRLTAVI